LTTTRELAGAAGAARSNPHRHALGVFVFSGRQFSLVAIGGMQEKTSAPHARLAYTHLQILLVIPYRQE
jgi:hypothetical protein